MYPGIDIIEIKRFELACQRNSRIVNRLFTERELESVKGKRAETLAGRFAAKEAVLKALGTGLRGLSWHDIEILSNKVGEPKVYLSEKAMETALTRGGNEVRLSITHSKEHAAALAILV